MVYFIRAIGTNRIKIGYTTNIEKRLLAYKTHSPFEVKLERCIELGSIEKEKQLEKELHKKYSEQRLHGEWFAIGSEAVNNVVAEYRSDIPTGFIRGALKDGISWAYDCKADRILIRVDEILWQYFPVASIGLEDGLYFDFQYLLDDYLDDEEMTDHLDVCRSRIVNFVEGYKAGTVYG